MSAVNETLTIAPQTWTGAAPSRAALVLIEGSGSQLLRLPASGELLIGRAPEAEVRLQDPTASRRHAKLLVAGGEVTLVDLGSHNGTQVNGAALVAPRRLRAGDVITVCDAVLVYKQEALAPLRTIVDEATLRARLAEEALRARVFQRRLALLHVRLPGGAELALLAGALAGRLRPVDCVAFTSGGDLLVLSPELGEGEAEDIAAGLLQALGPHLSGFRAGLACCPDDGVAADELLLAAATAAAQPGVLLRATALRRVRAVGDAELILLDPAMVQLYDLIERLAPSELPVLVYGETGCGKELAAGALHHWSPRRTGPLVAVNCAALAESLAESELFGHERGAFSGAHAARAGYFEAASGGTLFLDEIGEMPLALQAKLLRVLETQRVTRVGATQERAVRVRLVAATHRDLEAEVAAGRFRKDLYFRLSAATVQLLPLRERRGEIPPLARAFLARECALAGRAAPVLTAAVMHQLLAHEWPGNLRELRNLMSFLLATVRGDEVLLCHLPPRLREVTAPPEASAEVIGGKDTDDRLDARGAFVPLAPPAAAMEPAGGGGPGAAPDVAAAAEGGDAAGAAARSFVPLEEELRALERLRITEALEAAGGVHYRAAELIAMPLRTFANKVKLYGLSRRGGG